ncbi:stage II sporulation protein D [Mycoplasmatota bacterium WC44]
MKNYFIRIFILLLMTYMIPGIIYVFFSEDKVNEVIDDVEIESTLLIPYENIVPKLPNEFDIPVGVVEADLCDYNLKSMEIDNSIEITLVGDDIEVIGLDTYIVGVLAKEMNPKWPCEALKAQAVAGRTYVLKQLDKSDYILNSTIHQVYMSKDEMKKKWGSNFEDYYQKLMNIVLATKYEVIIYDNQFIDAVYFSTSNGYTQDSKYIWSNDIPYLKSVSSPWDKELTNLSREYRFTVDEFLYIFNKQFSTDIDYLSEIVVKRSTTGIFTEVKYKNHTITAEQLRNAYDLRSPVFGLKQSGNMIYVTTFGFGHLVGMSQYGAYGMALDGYSYEQIVKYYYKDVDIVEYNYLKS